MKLLSFTHLKFRFKMQFTDKNAAFSLIGLLLLLCLCSLNVAAHNSTARVDSANKMAESANISGPWARATFALAKTGAAYFSISNTGDTSLVLASVSVAPAIAMTAELHHTVMHSDMMEMQELTDGVEIKAGETVDFSPGGKHVMLMGLTGPLINGEAIVISLHFDDGSHIDQIFPILDKRNTPK